MASSPEITTHLQFPENFLWGASTSAHQTEGNNIHSDWWAWEQDGHIKNNETSQKAANSWELIDKDIDALKFLGANAYRFSIEWARIEPKQGEFDTDAIAHYRDLLIKLRQAGITPFVSLHHFTNPLWLSLKGGFERRASVDAFANYTQTIVNHLSDLVPFWVTINEPLVYVGKGWMFGEWPPQKNDFHGLTKALNNLVRSHKAAYDIIHKHSKTPNPEVGIAKHNQWFQPLTNNLQNILATAGIEYLWNHRFLQKIRNHQDYIGLNYYFKSLIEFRPNYPFIHDANAKGPDYPWKSDLGWEIHPHGIERVLNGLKQYHKPIYILENGLADASDQHRPLFLVEHLKAIHHSLESGIDIRGYLHWSLIDNFEWQEGFTPRFGLFETNYETFKRTPRPSAHLYKEIIRTHTVPAAPGNVIQS